MSLFVVYFCPESQQNHFVSSSVLITVNHNEPDHNTNTTDGQFRGNPPKEDPHTKERGIRCKESWVMRGEQKWPKDKRTCPEGRIRFIRPAEPPCRRDQRRMTRSQQA